jgi:hypothetical protein
MENIMIWEQPPLPSVEYRLYYDENGDVLFYTCEKPEGNYISIDAKTYAEGRPDVMVVNGKIIRKVPTAVITKLVPSENGFIVMRSDMSILTDVPDEDTTTWSVSTHELK